MKIYLDVCFYCANLKSRTNADATANIVGRSSRAKFDYTGVMRGLGSSALNRRERKMNTLSWLLYMAGVAGVATLLAGLVLTIAIILIIWSVLISDSPYEWMSDTQEEKEFKRTMPARKISVRKYAIKFFVVAGLVLLIIPSKSTVVMIAASELSEKAVETQTGQKALKSIEKFLDDYLNPPVRERRRRD